MKKLINKLAKTESWRPWRAEYLILLLCLFVYTPAISPLYAMHNDYSLMSPFKSLFGFEETRHLAFLGRPLGAVFINIPFQFIHSLSDVGVWRWINLGILFLLMRYLYRYVKRGWDISEGWLLGIVAAITILPGSTIMVLWVTQLIPGLLTLFLAIYAYQAFDRSRRLENMDAVKKRGLQIQAFVIFLIACAIYPPSALGVFSLSFLHIIFPRDLDIRQVRKTLIQDVVFFSLGIVVFFILNQFIIHPVLIKVFNAGFEYFFHDPHYQQKINLDWQMKLPLLVEILTFSAAGPWHFLMGERGAWIWFAGVILFLDFICLMPKTPLGIKKIEFLEKVMWGCVCILLANGPVLLAGGVDKVFGFRLYFPTAMMAVFLFFGMAQAAAQRWHRNVVIVLLVLGLGYSSLIVRDYLIKVSRNYIHEVEYVRSKLTQCPPEQVAKYYLIPLEDRETLVDFRPYLEYQLMIRTQTHLLPLIIDHLVEHHSKHFGGIEVASRTQWLYPDRPENCIIDFRESPHWRRNP